MDIPPEVAIKASIRPGSVYYFPHEALHSPESHFFVVINIDPFSEQVILLVCSSSKIDKVKRCNKHNAPETLVEIKREEYDDFTCDSILDCNTVFPESIESLVQRLASNRLDRKSEMDIALVEKLRRGVLASRQIAPTIKEQLGMDIQP